MRYQPGTLLRAACVLVLFFGSLVAVLVAVNTVFHGPALAQGPARFNQYLVLLATAALAVLFGLWIADGISVLRAGARLSAIYWPLLLGKGALLGILVILSINALDLLLHSLTLQWRWTDEPGLQIVTRLLFLALVVSYVWISAVTIGLRREPRE